MNHTEAVEQFRWLITEVDEVVFPEAIEALNMAIARFSPPQQLFEPGYTGDGFTHQADEEAAEQDACERAVEPLRGAELERQHSGDTIAKLEGTVSRVCPDLTEVCQGILLAPFGGAR